MSARETRWPRPHARTGERESLRRWVLIGAVVAVGAIALAALLARLADAEQRTLRELRVLEQRLESRSLLLADPRSPALLEALASTRDALRVRIVESLEAARERRDVRTLLFRIDERAVPDAEAVARLRLSLEGRLVHGAALLDVLDAVRVAVEPWPIETRGCLVQRLADVDVRIECALDILHWNGLDAPRVPAP